MISSMLPLFGMGGQGAKAAEGGDSSQRAPLHKLLVHVTGSQTNDLYLKPKLKPGDRPSPKAPTQTSYDLERSGS